MHTEVIICLGVLEYITQAGGLVIWMSSNCRGSGVILEGREQVNLTRERHAAMVVSIGHTRWSKIDRPFMDCRHIRDVHKHTPAWCWYKQVKCVTTTNV